MTSYEQYRKQFLDTQPSHYIPYGYTSELRRRRTTYTPDQLNALDEEYDKNAYMDLDGRTKLAAELKLSEAQVKVWFQNRRARSKKDIRSDSDEQKMPLSVKKRISYTPVNRVNSEDDGLDKSPLNVNDETRSSSRRSHHLARSTNSSLQLSPDGFENKPNNEVASLFIQLSSFDMSEFVELTQGIHEEGDDAYKKMTETFK